MKRINLMFLSLLAMLLLFPAFSLAGMGGENLLSPGYVAPDFKFTDIDGKEDTIHNVAKGKPVLLVFLQVKCRSCQREMEFLKELQEKNELVDVMAFFVDSVKLDFQAFKKDNGLPFRFAWDGDYAIAEAYGVAFTPASFLLDSERKIAKVYKGWSRSGKEMEEDIKTLRNATK